MPNLTGDFNVSGIRFTGERIINGAFALAVSD